MNIEISITSLLKIFVFLTVLSLLIFMKELLALLFLSYILYAAFNSLVERIQSYKIGNFGLNRSLSIALVTLFVVSLLTFLIWAVIGPSAQEIIELFTGFDTLVEDVVKTYNLNWLTSQTNLIQIQTTFIDEILKILQEITQSPNSILNFGRNIFGGFLTTITIVSITVYQIIEPGKIKDFIVSLFPSKDKENVNKVMLEVEDKLGKWLGGQLFLMFLIGVLSYIGLSLIGIDFALPLAIIFGLLDIIPIIGPIIAFIPLAIVALATAEPWQSIAAMIFFVVIQQLEGNFLVPKIMQKSVGLDPVVVIISLMIGSQVLGVLGAVISIPVAVILVILYQNWLEKKQNEEIEAEKLESRSLQENHFNTIQEQKNQTKIQTNNPYSKPTDTRQNPIFKRPLTKVPSHHNNHK
jgi:predicted PurR-regulated permease PerM